MKHTSIVKPAGSRKRRAASLGATLFGLACALLPANDAKATSAEDSLTYFYSDGTYTTVVGRCRCICGGSCRYSGIQTPWDKVISQTPCAGAGLEERCYIVFAGMFLPVPCPNPRAVGKCSGDGGKTWYDCPY